MATGELKDGSDNIDFLQFDILSGGSYYSDHHFNESDKYKEFKDCKKNPRSAVSKAIAKEWKILKEHLPECIYVRVYEDRLDLLRAVIIGTPGTPYHDGLFFFDIVLPSDYPNQPPKVHYHAHGMRLNPNLYSSGYVCLSLLHTWHGSGKELWTNKSTILQLLVSLQGLVLNDNPYFNEPGNEILFKNMSESYMEKSIAYNEDVFISSCKTMLHKVQKPPRGFESFVVAHIRSRGDFILAAITAYKHGDAAVGQYIEVPSAVSSPSLRVSEKFKSNLEKIHSDLKLAFHKIDPSVEIQEKKEENEEAPVILNENAGNSGSFLGNVFKLLKKVFGW